MDTRTVSNIRNVELSDEIIPVKVSKDNIPAIKPATIMTGNKGVIDSDIKFIILLNKFLSDFPASDFVSPSICINSG